MIYLLYGSDTYRSRKKLQEIIAEYQRKMGGVYDFHKLDAAEDNLSSLKSLTDMQSLFSKKKLVVVENVFTDLEDTDLLVKSIEKIRDSRDVVAVLWDKAVDKKKLLFIEKIATKVQEFKSLTGASLQKFIEDESGKRGLKLYPAHLLKINGLGSDLWAVTRELDKLMVAGNEAMLEKENAFDEKKIFDLADTFFSQRKIALQVLLQLLHQGEDEFGIFTYLANHARKLLIIKSYLENRQPVPSSLGIHPYIVQKSSSILREIPMKKLEKILVRFFEEDGKIKIGLSSPQESLLNILYAI